ncbi:MAG TPA: class I SAM-dependent methyltransferase [Nitrospirales bacterium]|nr:class I SAM-dependent methyltransferase [Nitrospirales bacterium]
MPYRGVVAGPIGRWALAHLMTPRRATARGGLVGNADALTRGARALETFGTAFLERVKDAVVIDHGCGYGDAVAAVARAGAREAVGLDIRDAVLEAGRRIAVNMGVGDRCRFVNITSPNALEPWIGRADVVLSIDAFTHYLDPEQELRRMRRLLRSGGRLYVSFGPPWWHPNGCHMMPFGAPPWAHLVFAEQVILDVRRRFRGDGARRFEHVEGGLNRMSVRRFERLMTRSGFQVTCLECVPIRGVSPLARLPIGRELFTSIVQAEAVKP